MGSDLKGKADVLAYLRENGFPTPTVYAEIPLGSLVRGLPGKIILRSDHPGEIDGFEGVFDSLVMDFHSEQLLHYCKQMGYDPKQVLPNLKLQVQEYLPYAAIGRIYSHPHNERQTFMAFQLHTTSTSTGNGYYGDPISGSLKLTSAGDYERGGFYDPDETTRGKK